MLQSRPHSLLHSPCSRLQGSPQGLWYAEKCRLATEGANEAVLVSNFYQAQRAFMCMYVQAIACVVSRHTLHRQIHPVASTCTVPRIHPQSARLSPLSPMAAFNQSVLDRSAQTKCTAARCVAHAPAAYQKLSSNNCTQAQTNARQFYPHAHVAQNRPLFPGG